MNQQPDKLFRDKLQSFQTPAPSGAWNRIEANLNKKNDTKILWFRIAASLLLVAIATYFLWPANSAITSPTELADKTKTPKREIVKPGQKKEENVIPQVAVEGIKIAKQEKREVSRSTKAKRQKSIEQNNQPILTEEKTEATENTLAVADNNAAQLLENNSTAAETQTSVVAAAETQKLKIIFLPEEVDNKYLDKKALAEATSDDKKPSTFKKLLDKAYDLKYNQDPFGDLRQRKDEILALNFRKDKRSDNK